MGASINFHLGDATPEIRAVRTGHDVAVSLEYDCDNLSIYFATPLAFVRAAQRMLEQAERLHREERQAVEETTPERSAAPF